VTDLELARHLAAIADEVALPFASGYVRTSWKPDGSPVTEADLAVDRAIREELALRRPDDAVLTEESGASGAGNRRWLIDPIDGTAYFVDGLPSWGAHIALEIDGVVSVAVVTRPALGRSWYASLGGGAFRDDRDEPLRVSGTVDLADAVIGGYTWSRPDIVTRVNRVARWSYDSSPLLSLLDGDLDAVIGKGGYAWDLAPAVLLVAEAGGRYADPHGGLRYDMQASVASNRILHDQVEALAYP
jgi:histidinol-phosphatase